MNSFATLRRGGVRIGLTLFFTFVVTISRAHAEPILVENFDDVSALSASGWTLLNLSSPLGTTGWFQGNDGVFTAQDGASNSYIAANFLGADLGTVDELLISPVLTLNNGDVLTFFARTSTAAFNDGLEVLLDDGTNLITLLALTTPPDSGWTEYALTVTGLAGPTAAQFVFNYFVGNTNFEGDYIGIDSVRVDPVPEPSTLSLLGLGVAAGVRSWRRRRVRS